MEDDDPYFVSMQRDIAERNKRIADLETALRAAIALIRTDDHPTRQGMADNFEKTLNA
jgi:hypothetical protein